MEKLLLHACCGPCSTTAINEFAKGHEIALYFYNPNIHPKEEYEKRLEQARKVAGTMKKELIEGKYDSEEWKEATKRHKEEKEGGRRCELCFEFRLAKTAEKAKELGIKYFATTLSTGPRKNAKSINEAGNNTGKNHGIRFIEADLKKRDGYLKSLKISKEMGLYRQHYCGCEYSLRSSIASPKL
jgi:predicted adenine nucleotide alpha hydrolase (AANH) superfamily ATPase